MKALREISEVESKLAAGVADTSSRSQKIKMDRGEGDSTSGLLINPPSDIIASSSVLPASTRKDGKPSKPPRTFRSRLRNLIHVAGDPTPDSSSPSSPPPTFIYKDWDNEEIELGEIYGFYEAGFIQHSKQMFDEYMIRKKMEEGGWKGLKTDAAKCNVILDLLDELEVADQSVRFKSLWSVSYLIQGCWGENETLDEQMICAKKNVKLLLSCDAFWRIWKIFVNLLNIANHFRRWSLIEQTVERCLNILITIVYLTPQVHESGENDNVFFTAFVEELETDLEGDDSILEILVKAFCKIAEANPINYILKKILLLMRRVLLLVAGGSEKIKQLKESCRKAVGLNNCTEDTIETGQNMKLLQDFPFWINNGRGNLENEEGSRMFTLEQLADLVWKEERANSLKPEDWRLPWMPKCSVGKLQPHLLEFSVKNKAGTPISKPLKQRLEILMQYLYIPLGDFHKEQEELLQSQSICPKYCNKLQKVSQVSTTERIFDVILPSLKQFISTLMNTFMHASCVSKINLNNVFVPRDSSSNRELVKVDSSRQAEIITKAIASILILLLKHTKINHILQFELIALYLYNENFLTTGYKLLSRDVNRFRTSGNISPVSNICVITDWPFKVLGCEFSTNLYDHQYSWRSMFTMINVLRVMNKLVKGNPKRIKELSTFHSYDTFKNCLKLRNNLMQVYSLKLLKMQWKYLEPSWKRKNSKLITAIFLKVRHRLLDDWMGDMINLGKAKVGSQEQPAKRQIRDSIDKGEGQGERTLHIAKSIEVYLLRKIKSSQLVPTVSDTILQAREGTSNDALCFPVSIMEIDWEAFNVSDWFKMNYEEWLKEEVYTKNINWDSLIADPKPL